MLLTPMLLTAVEETAVYTLNISKEIVSLMENVRDSMQNKNPKIYSHELVEALSQGIKDLVGPRRCFIILCVPFSKKALAFSNHVSLSESTVRNQQISSVKIG